MSNFRPIAMRCTQEQFEEIKPKLKGVSIHSVNFDIYTRSGRSSYLTNNLSGKNYVVSNICEFVKREYNREVHEEWNEEVFLKACGIIPCTIQDRLANLENELKEVKALIEEENKPKKGDICKFWDDDKSIFIVGKLIYVAETGIYRYYIHGTAFKNYMKITDENFLSAFDNL